MFISFVSFYWRLIQGFSRIAASLTSRVKTTKSFEKLALRAFRANNNKVVKGGGGRANETIVDLSKPKNNKFEKLTRVLNIRAIGKPIFLTSNAKKTFNYLKQVFIKAPILQYFNFQCHI